MSIGKKMFPKKKSWARENPESPILTVRFDGDLKILGVFPISPPPAGPSGRHTGGKGEGEKGADCAKENKRDRETSRDRKRGETEGG